MITGISKSRRVTPTEAQANISKPVLAVGSLLVMILVTCAMSTISTGPTLKGYRGINHEEGRFNRNLGIKDNVRAGDPDDPDDPADPDNTDECQGTANCKVIRGIGLIADFADVALEDYQFPDFIDSAVRNEKQVREILDDMSEHWRWMSQGKSIFKWDIIRITLDESLTSDAFPGWFEYRNAVVRKVLEKVNVSDYDYDSDGIIDSIYIIAASDGSESPYVTGGASQNLQANVFDDRQDAGSLRGRHIGNFNHEVAHNLGLPDLYGDYSNLDDLTIMADSWPLPPLGFSAWEKYKLGWLEPRVITKNTAGVVLYPAEDHLEAVLIPTARASEYFLIEYRKRPDVGYGSTPAAPFDGLAIYHVWELADNNNGLPGIIRLEPPSGVYNWGGTPDVNDFWYPGNPISPSSYQGSPFYNEANVLVELHSFRLTGDGGMGFDVNVFDVGFPPGSNPDPIPNGDFEAGCGDQPELWTADSYSMENALMTWEANVGVGGSHCIRIENTSPNDSRYIQTVNGLKAGMAYKISGLLKVLSIDMSGSSIGASISLLGYDDWSTWIHSEPINSVTSDWRYVELTFVADSESIVIACRLGHFGSTVTGVVLCDDLKIEVA